MPCYCVLKSLIDETFFFILVNLRLRTNFCPFFPHQYVFWVQEVRHGKNINREDYSQSTIYPVNRVITWISGCYTISAVKSSKKFDQDTSRIKSHKYNVVNDDIVSPISSMVEYESMKLTESMDWEISTGCSLASFVTLNTNSNISFLNHVYIICSVTDSTDYRVSEKFRFLDESNNYCFVVGRASELADICRFGYNLFKLSG